MDRLDQQIRFTMEIDKLKTILRRSYITAGEKLENSAEHCWHAAVLASLLSEYSDHEINESRVIKMLLLHDIVEIDAGDTYFFDEKGNADKEEREQKAADRLFGLLPEDQAQEFRAIWEEYEKRESNDAKFAYALDRFIPVLHSYHTQGKSWKQHGIKLEQVLTLNVPIREGSEKLWKYAENLFKDAVTKGFLKP